MSILWHDHEMRDGGQFSMGERQFSVCLRGAMNCLTIMEHYNPITPCLILDHSPTVNIHKSILFKMFIHAYQPLKKLWHSGNHFCSQYPQHHHTAPDPCTGGNIYVYISLPICPLCAQLSSTGRDTTMETE